jgi:phosphatidylinositol glycan class V
METERSAQSATPIMQAPDATVQSSRVNWAIPWRRLFSMETPEGWKRDFQRLAWPFFLWKALLLTLAALCPGPGYDTSALIFIDPSLKRHKTFSNSSWGDRLILNLFRWDALYFIKAAVRGKVHEQEWAFSWAYSWLLSYVGQSPPFYNGSKSVLQQRIMATIDISTACHLGSVWMLFRLLTVTVESPRKHQIARLGAILHIMTPASLFLSSPYAEAPFSLLNITGMLLYAQSRTLARDQQHSVLGDAYKLGSGLLFGAATLMRGNGLLSGLILLYDLASYLPQVFSMRLTVHDVRRMIVTCVAGGIIALCFVWPQYLAYVEYCSGEDVSDGPPWCQRTIPSIYSWVQSHYW